MKPNFYSHINRSNFWGSGNALITLAHLLSDEKSKPIEFLLEYNRIIKSKFEKELHGIKSSQGCWSQSLSGKEISVQIVSLFSFFKSIFYFHVLRIIFYLAQLRKQGFFHESDASLHARLKISLAFASKLSPIVFCFENHSREAA